MTMATETENNGPPAEAKEIKDVKELKDALTNEPAPDNKQQQDEAGKDTEKKESEKKDEGASDAAAAPAKAVTVHKTNYEKDIVYLYQFSRMPLLPSLSPYCLKVETWLRLNNIKYEVSIKVLFEPI